jgi:hypothetical protein
MRVKKLTPVMFVPAIEPCIAFWTERLGFSMTAEVKNDDGRYVFALLAHPDGVQVMYQTEKSIEEDMTTLEARDRKTSVVLYVDVDDLDTVEAKLKGVPVIVPRRTTFYGAHEMGWREPGGNVLVCAQHD